MRNVGVMALVVGLACLLGACSTYCDPCPGPCAPKPCATPCPPPPPPCNPCSPCNEPNPCAPPPCNPCQDGCQPNDLPCTCACTFVPTVDDANVTTMLSYVANQAQWHFNNAPAPLKPDWQALRDTAIWFGSPLNHGTCTRWSCIDWWNKVKACRDAIAAVQNQAPAPVPAICSELNHTDPPSAYGGRR
jgi:hypothetical protein